MTSRTTRIVVALLGLGLLGASGQQARSQQQLYDIAVPGRYPLDPHKTRGDILLAVLAAQQAARRDGDLGKGTGHAEMAPGAKAVFTDRDPQFRLEGFALTETSINSMAPSARGADGQRLFGLMRFAHPSGLGATIGFIVDYQRRGEGIVVNELSALTVTPPDPRVSVLAIATPDLARIEQRASGRFQSMFEALSLVGKPLPLAPADTKAGLTIIALGADRLLPGDHLEIKVSDPSGRPMGGLPAPRQHQIGGFVAVSQDFPAAVSPGRIAVTLLTDLHPKATDGRNLLGTRDLVASAAPANPPPASPAIPPAPPAATSPSAPRTETASDGWQFDDPQKPAQLTFATAARKEDPELFVVCDRPNAEQTERHDRQH